MKKPILLLCSLWFIAACNLPSGQEEVITTSGFNLSNPAIQDLINLQDKRDAKELAIYFNHVDPQFRYAAAMAFASIQDTATAEVINGLTELTEDEDEAVRYAAVYALGQMRHPIAAEILKNSFKNDMVTGSNRINSRILEGIGKTAPANYLDYLVKPKNYKDTDTLLLEGQVYGIYQFALRGITSQEGTAKMVAYAIDLNKPASVRRMAAHYLARAKDIDFNTYTGRTIRALEPEPDAYTRMALVLALGKSEDQPRVIEALTTHFNIEKDYRVRLNILRILGGMEDAYFDTRPAFIKALKDGNVHVQNYAAEYFQQNGERVDVDFYYSYALDSNINNAHATNYLLGAALANVSYTRGFLRKKINDTLIANYQNTTNPYEKGDILEVLAGFPVNYSFIKDETFNMKNHPYTRTKGIEALGIIRKNPKLSLIFGPDYPLIERFFNNAFKEAITSGDVALTGIAAGIIRDPSLNFKTAYVDDYSFLLDAMKKLKLPKDTETKYELEKTLAYFQGKDQTPPTEVPEYNHPIDWSVFKNLASNSFVRIKTNKGDILVHLFRHEAPGTVSNFIKLANDKFYNDKTFHRVVGNFVIQGGCPRGDGWGSLDYSIRSELSDLRYNEEGYIGMASAGKDTEGTQWFITHSPTPHLDGKYTIFGKVVDGMEVVHKITLGDNIETVTIETPKEEIEE